MAFSKKTTLLTNIFNESYLLPFWLHHHKDMFDEIIIIDYNSTDNSVEICKNICPDCKIIKTRNEYFDAEYIDLEFMDIENNIEGIKIILNTTEFLICEKPIKDIFPDNRTNISYDILANSPYSLNNYEINNYYELFNNLLNNDIVFHQDRFVRHLHNYPNGNYTIGRHSTKNHSIPNNDVHIIWFGYYPMNDKLLKRKLQIQQNIPQRDKDRGFGFHHLFNKEKMLCMNDEKSRTGRPLKEINLSLYNYLYSKYRKNSLL